MSGYEVPTPILNSPFHEPAEHWNIVEGEEPVCLPGRRPAMYFYRDPRAGAPGGKPDSFGREAGTAIELKLDAPGDGSVCEERRLGLHHSLSAQRPAA